MSVIITILTVVLVIVSILMVLVVLMQRPKQEGLGAAFGGGMMDSIAGAGATDLLQKITTWLAVIFFVCAILIGILTTKQIAARNEVKVLEGFENREEVEPGPPPVISPMPENPPAESDKGGSSAPTPAPVAPDADKGKGTASDKGKGADKSKAAGKDKSGKAPAPAPAGDSKGKAPAPSGENSEKPKGDGK